MLLGVSNMDRVKVFQLVAGFRDSQGLLCPINSGVCDMEPEESKDNIFSSAAHDIEEMFLSDPFDVCVQDTGVVDCTSLVCSLVYVSDSNGGSKFFCRELVFSDKLLVDVGNVSTRIY